MFKVKSIFNDHVYTVYAVSGTMFLIYIEEPQDCRWEWRDMSEFKPVQHTGQKQDNTRRN